MCLDEGVAAMWALAGGSHDVAYPAQTLYGQSKAAASSFYDVKSGGNSWCDGESFAKCKKATLKISGKTEANPNGLPKSVFDGFQAALAANRSQFYRDVASGPFYGYNRPGAKPSEAVIQNWWRQGMTGGAKAHYDGIVAFSQTDFTEDLKKINVPVLVMHSEDDQIVPYVAAGPLSAKLLKNGTLKTYKGFPHGMPTTEAETINADLLAFFKS